MIRFLKSWAPASAFLLLAIMAGAPQAHADLILEGDSDASYFDNLGGTIPNTSLACLVSCAAGTFDRVILGSTASGGGTSYLDILDTSFSVNGNPGDVINDVLLAELKLTVANKPGEGQLPTFNYTIILTFTTPLTSDTQTLALSMTGNGASGAGAAAALSIDGLDASLLTYPTLAGVTLSNFYFDPVGTTSTLTGDLWKVTGNSNIGTLQLLATVTVAACQENDPRDACNVGQNEIPEPTTLALFGAGLFGYGLMRRRRRKANA